MIYVNAEKTASFDVDAQYAFTSECPKELPISGAIEIVPALNKQAMFAAFRLGSKDAHNPKALWVATENQPMYSEVKGENMDIAWNLHAVPGTKGFDLIEGLPRPAEYDYFVWKGVELDMHPYGACYHDLSNNMSTGVIEFLNIKSISTVIVGGLATDYCVKTTAIQLSVAGFKVIVNLEACRGVENKSIAMAIQQMLDHGIRLIDKTEEIGVLA